MKKQIIDAFLDYFNNFITLEKFAEYYGISESAAKKIIDAGREMHENEVAFQKFMISGEF